MNTLCMQFTRNSWRGMSEEEAEALVFGRLLISVHSDQGEELMKVVDMHVGLKELAAWLRENRDRLLAERIPTGELHCSSIAEAVAHFYETTDVDNENVKVAKQLYDYRTSHCLWFGQRGTNMPDVYLGLFRETYEVSIYTQTAKWRFEVDLSAFLDRAEKVYGELQ